jgi:hypothetical protein
LLKLRRRRRNHQTTGNRRLREELPNTLNLLEQVIEHIIEELGHDAFRNISGASGEKFCQNIFRICFHE